MRYALIIFGLFAFIANKAQAQTFSGRSVQTLNTKNLEKQFLDYDLYQVDINAIDAFAKSGATDVDFKLLLGHKYDWDFSITPVDIRSENYTLTTERDGELVQLPVSENLTFRGSIQDHSSSIIALTLDEDFMYGFVRIGNEEWYIEPLWYFDRNAPRDQIVVYHSNDVRWDQGRTCGATETKKRKQSFGSAKHNLHNQKSSTTCYEVDLAIASDRAMFETYGTVEAVETRNIAVNNNVITDYDDDFVYEIDFSIVTQFVVTNDDNPWGFNTGTPGAFSVLDAFRDWGNDGGFGVDYDLASVWTDLDFQGSTVGIAGIIGSVCSSWRYNALQDFSSNAASLRVLTSHEYGHNFDAEHDDSTTGTIMSTGVSNTTNWSAESIASIDGHIISRVNSGCLTACSSDPPLSAPTANFTSESTAGCAPLSVQFTNESSANTTAWTWSFEAGTPSSSTEQNPTITYNQQGNFEVALIASNPAGNDTVSQTIFIAVEDVPTASFEATVDFTTVNFTNTSLGGNSYVWDFGDGNFSADENPVHTYASPDSYTVTLTVTNDCGETTFSETVVILVSSLNEIDAINTFNVFPNPTKSTFTLALSGKPIDDLSYQIFNVMGQELDRMQLDFKSGNLVQQFDYPALAKGVYVIRLMGDGGYLQRKLVVE